MFAGLLLTSISAATMRAALFQRKSRSGWLEELDGIREDALEEPAGGVAHVAAGAGDIWTDLRDGGEYDDPHEISSLYADDTTPDLPVTKPAAKAAPKPEKAAPKPPKAAKAKKQAAAQAELPPPPAQLPPPPVQAPAAEDVPAPEAAPAAEVESLWADADADITAASGQYDTDQIWVQPAPHPIRPSEMWHPAELAPPRLGDESFEHVPEERVASADLEEPSDFPFDRAVPVEPDTRVTHRLESELAVAADITVLNDPPPSSLVPGPVGRRVRRDRPDDRRRSSLPIAPAAAEIADGDVIERVEPVVADPAPRPADPAPADRGEQSPLPTAPLPPAALPTRSNRLPELDTLPATPSSVVAPKPVVPEPAAPAAPAPPVVVDLAVAADGTVDLPGTILRIGGTRLASATSTDGAASVALRGGWCWASPGDGPAHTVSIELPNGRLTVAAGATALAVVEADGSSFVILADGSADLSRGDDGGPLQRGSIVMIDPSGAAQVDHASDDEIASDPVVAENLALDAER